MPISPAFQDNRSRWTVGKYYAPEGLRSAFAGYVVDRAYYTPLWVPFGVRIDRIGITVTSGGGTGSVTRLGVYADNGHGIPGTRLLDAGTVDSTGTGQLELTVDLALPSPLVWLVASPQVGTIATYRSLAGDSLYPIAAESAAVAASANGIDGYQQVSVSGALPSTAAIAGAVGACPFVCVRAA